jgi:hypothetical protein
MSADPSRARPKDEWRFFARASMPSAPSMMADDHRSAPPRSIIAGVPTTQQAAAARPRAMAKTVIWLGVIGVSYTSRQKA